MSTEITINQDQIDINVDTTVVTIEAPQGGYPLPNNVYSVFGRIGNVVAQEGDYTLTQLGGVTITNPLTGQALVYNGTSWVNNTETYVGTVTSVNMSVPTGLTISGNPITTAGTLAVGLQSGYSIPTTASQATWNTAYNDSIVSAAVTGVQTKTLTLNQQDGGTITASWSDYDTAPVTSVFGRTGAITAQSGDYNTLQVTENTNLYFTDQRARFAISGDATSGVVYSNTTGIIALDDIPNTSLLNPSLTVNNKTVALGGSTTLTTSDIGEGTNLYFTTARAQAAISGTAPISVASGVVSISQANSTTNGYLSSADWTTFNSKQNALTLSNLTSSDITVTGGTGAVVGSGSTLTLATVNSNVGQFGSSTAIPVITVNAKGLTTAISTVAVSIPSGSLSFIGDVTGTGSTGSDTTLTLATVNSNVGAYGSSTSVPTITVNAKGLVTAASQTAIPTATSSVTGLLTSTDWSTFNAKQAQLNGTGFVKVSGTTVTYDNSTYLTTIEGIAAGGELSGTYASPSLVNSAVTGKVLTGVNITGGTIQATDSILTAFGKIQNQINGLIGGSIYQGTWNASTNTPTLTSGVGTKGYYYIVSVAGTTNLDGITDWNVGDWAIYDGTAWQQVDNTDAVVSVNGFTGAVSLTTSNISEGTNLYYTDARARGSVSAGTGISYNSTTGVITNSAPDQTVALTASTGISTTGTYPNFTITNTAPDQTVSLTSGTGISATGTYPSFTITNTAPDQTVSLTGAGTTSISGTYPNFTITSNDQYVGTVTSVGITESAAALTITGSPVTTSGNINIGFAGNSGQYVAGDGSLVNFPTVVTQAQNLVTEVYNNSGATITKGTVVYINGGQGNLPTITKAQANTEVASNQTIGLVRADITNMNNGYVTVAGTLIDLDTNGFSTGQTLYLSPSVAGGYTSTKPTSPNHIVYVGVVVRAHPTQGVIEVKIQNTQELSESSDVLITTPTNGQILQYDSATSLWKNVAGTTSSIAEGSNLYYTDARARGAISLTTTGNNGASTYNSTTGVLNIPTYTLAGLGGINLTSLSATSPLLYDNTTGVFSIQQSSGSQAGFLSAADWTTFNSKQGAITLTTIGSSGAATFSAGTLNIPNYTLSGLGGVPTSRTITINGTTQDLSANQTWTISSNVNATNTQDYTATANQTVFTVTGGYTVGQLAVFYNGSKLASNEFTATNGTTFVLATACQANDIVQAVVAVTGGGIGGSGTTNYISKWTASGVLNNSQIFDNGTNVGIGTASPSAKLEVNGGHIRAVSTQTDIQINSTSNTQYSRISFEEDGAQKAQIQFINSGFGAPRAGRLEIANAATGGQGISFISSVSAFTNPQMFISNAGNIGINTSTVTEGTQASGSISIIPVSSVSSGPLIQFPANGRIRPASTGDRLSIDGNALFLNSFIGGNVIMATGGGNVGIGTSSATNKLTISNNGNSAVAFRINDTNANASFLSMNASNTDAAIIAGGTSAIPFDIYTSNTARFRINTDGVVLIGASSVPSGATSADGGSLFVNSNLYLGNTSGTTGYAFRWDGFQNTIYGVWSNASGGDVGGVSLAYGATSFSPFSSDVRTKKNFETTQGLNEVLNIEPVKYHLLADDDNSVKRLGFKAQNLETLIPEMVYKTGRKLEDGSDILTIIPDYLLPVLVKAIQEQQKQIEELKQLVK
jgi:hypothetical protein